MTEIRVKPMDDPLGAMSRFNTRCTVCGTWLVASVEEELPDAWVVCPRCNHALHVVNLIIWQ